MKCYRKIIDEKGDRWDKDSLSFIDGMCDDQVSTQFERYEDAVKHFELAEQKTDLNVEIATYYVDPPEVHKFDFTDLVTLVQGYEKLSGRAREQFAHTSLFCDFADDDGMKTDLINASFSARKSWENWLIKIVIPIMKETGLTDTAKYFMGFIERSAELVEVPEEDPTDMTDVIAATAEVVPEDFPLIEVPDEISL